MKTRNLKMYHNQAERDRYSEIPDLSDRIITTTFKEIMEAYREELMSDLMLEAQEAY